MGFFRQPDDWLAVTLTDAYDVGMPRKNTIQFVEMLKEKYPDHDWGKMFTLRGKFGQQRRLEKAVSSLFPVL